MFTFSYMALIGEGHGAIEGFEAFIEIEASKEVLAKHFQFLGIPLTNVSVFGSDYELRFSRSGIEVVLHNDDFGSAELESEPEETVHIRIQTPIKEVGIKFADTLRKKISLAEK